MRLKGEVCRIMELQGIQKFLVIGNKPYWFHIIVVLAMDYVARLKMESKVKLIKVIDFCNVSSTPSAPASTTASWCSGTSILCCCRAPTPPKPPANGGGGPPSPPATGGSGGPPRPPATGGGGGLPRPPATGGGGGPPRPPATGGGGGPPRPPATGGGGGGPPRPPATGGGGGGPPWPAGAGTGCGGGGPPWLPATTGATGGGGSGGGPCHQQHVPRHPDPTPAGEGSGIMLNKTLCSRQKSDLLLSIKMACCNEISRH
uniref:Uncharacterized protein n=1 Tax=Amphimedon queenslandica TaxID=400682 RepID=A0A1X7VDE3_AMPQE